ncbi:MAG: pilus assembly protein [Mobilitalea sp.]
MKNNPDTCQINNNKGRFAKGSITVEAAFVIPIVFCVIFILLYLAFFLHDKCKIQGIVDQALYKTGLSIKYEADISKNITLEQLKEKSIFTVITGYGEDEEIKIEEYLDEKLFKGFFLLKVSSIEVTVERFKVYIGVSAKTKNNLPLLNFILNPITKLKASNIFSLHDPAEAIRGAEVILQTGDKIKGVHELLEMLKKGLH